MKRTTCERASTLLVLVACAPACAPRGQVAPALGGARTASIATARERASIAGGHQHFTGKATISMLFAPNGPRDFGGAYVTFQPGARTAWHTHPAGQTLVVTAGDGWVQIEGQARRDMHPGDVVWIPPNVRHWHGATASSAMTHLALQGGVGGTVVTWLEHVSETQYLGGESPTRPGGAR